MHRFNRDTVYTLCILKTNLWTEILHNFEENGKRWDFLAVIVRISGS